MILLKELKYAVGKDNRNHIPPEKKKFWQKLYSNVQIPLEDTYVWSINIDAFFIINTEWNKDCKKGKWA